MANKRFKGCKVYYYHRGEYIHRTIGCGGKESWYTFANQSISADASATVGAAMRSIDTYRSSKAHSKKLLQDIIERDAKLFRFVDEIIEKHK